MWVKNSSNKVVWKVDYMLWDVGQDCGTDEGKARCDRGVEDGESDDVGGEDG